MKFEALASLLFVNHNTCFYMEFLCVQFHLTIKLIKASDDDGQRCLQGGQS